MDSRNTASQPWTTKMVLSFVRFFFGFFAGLRGGSAGRDACASSGPRRLSSGYLEAGAAG